jgi:hypothetical protein
LWYDYRWVIIQTDHRPERCGYAAVCCATWLVNALQGEVINEAGIVFKTAPSGGRCVFSNEI